MQGFQAQPDYLARLIGQLTGRSVVLFIDQLEELFSVCPNKAEREAFLSNVLSLTHVKDRQHRVIVTMRVDFEEFVQLNPAFQQQFVAGRAALLPLSPAELREAIERPAEQVGLKFETGVVDRLLNDILGEPAGLPLLQVTLLRLWEERRRNRVTQEVYDHVGGGRLALARTADAFYDTLLPEEQVTARRILLRMVRPGSGTEVTSSRILRSAVFIKSDASDRVNWVLDKLIAARLVRLTKGETPEGDQIEVAHEALVRNWPRLVEWTEQERDSLRQRLRLRDSARQWDAVGRDATLLWRGTLLDEAIRYEDIDEIERLFVRASLLSDARIVKEEALRQRELATARALAEEQGQRAKAEYARATAERARAEEQAQRVEIEQQRAAEQARSARRLGLLSLGLLVALAVAIIGALLAGFQQVVLGQTKAESSTAQAAQATAVVQQQTALSQKELAVMQAGTAQAVSKTAAAAATDSAKLQQAAEAQAFAAQNTVVELEAQITANDALVESAQQTASAIQTTAQAIQQQADVARTAEVQAKQQAEAAIAEAEKQGATANQARTTAAQQQAIAGAAQATAAQAESKARVVELQSTAIIRQNNEVTANLLRTADALNVTATALAPSPDPRTPTRTPDPRTPTATSTPPR